MFPNLGEFNFIQTLLKDAAGFKKEPPATRGWLGVGDDCAQFDGWLVTKDLSVENTHFRLDWSTPEQAVEKHIVSNVSDISAMGGIPRFAAHHEWLRPFIRSISATLRLYFCVSAWMSALS